MYRTIVDMKNSNALITKAMLASYLNDRRVDYLDMISPFIIRSLPEEIDSEIDISLLSETLSLEYGLNINQKTIEKILIRLAKTKNGSIIRKESRASKGPRDGAFEKKYYVNQVGSHEEFDRRKEKIKNSVNEVITRLRDYINENYACITNVTLEQAEKYFLTFLENYNYELYSNVDNLREIQTNPKNNKNNFRVAKFILHEHSLEHGCYDKIKEIQSGFFASMAIYYFCNSDNSDNPKKIIDGTRVFLDTRLLIDVLGLNKESEKISMAELVSLIKANGGQLCTFDYYVEELSGIIHRYLKDKSSRHMLDLDYFRRAKSNDVEIALYEKTVKSKLTEKGIDIITDVDFSKQIKEQTWHIDSLELRKNMISLITYSGVEGDPAFDNDVTTLERISFYKCDSVKNNTQKAIFVTSNSGIIKAARTTFTDKILRDDISIVISDIDLAATLWLSNYTPSSELSNMILLENAYAAICPTKDILNAVINIIEKNMETSDTQLKEDAWLLRSHSYLLEDISDITQNDKSAVNEEIFDKLYGKLKQHIRDDSYEEFYQQAVQNLRIDVKQELEDELKSREKELLLQQKRMEKERIESKQRDDYKNNLLKESEEDKKQIANKLKKEQEKSKALREAEMERCKNQANMIAAIFKYGCYILLFLFCFYIGYRYILSLLMPILNTESGSLEHTIINFIITILGTAFTFAPALLSLKRGIQKLCNKVYDKFYVWFCGKSKVLNYE